MSQKVEHTGGWPWYIIMAGVYVGLLIYFGYQTWGFVSWLFPSDALAMQILGLLCFDILAFLWACVDLFYKFAHKSIRQVVRWAWGISFVLSLLASILYLSISNMFRFHVAITEVVVQAGEGVVILALTLNILFLMTFLYREWMARHPQEDGLNIPAAQQPAPVYSSYSAPQTPQQTTGELELYRMIVPLLQQQMTGGSTDKLPLVQPQQQNSTGSMPKKTAKAPHKAPANTEA